MKPDLTREIRGRHISFNVYDAVRSVSSHRGAARTEYNLPTGQSHLKIEVDDLRSTSFSDAAAFTISDKDGTPLISINMYLDDLRELIKDTVHF